MNLLGDIVAVVDARFIDGGPAAIAGLLILKESITEDTHSVIDLDTGTAHVIKLDAESLNLKRRAYQTIQEVAIYEQDTIQETTAST